MRKQEIFFNCAIFLTILLWVYTVGSKLAHFDQFRLQLIKQPFSREMANTLLYALPTIELVAIALLSINRTRFLGFCLSFGLLLAFTIYIALIIANFYDHIPCSCGGILNKMSWRSHFWFNAFFIAITGYGLAWSAWKTKQMSG